MSSRALAAFQAALIFLTPPTQGVGLRPRPWAKFSRPFRPVFGRSEVRLMARQYNYNDGDEKGVIRSRSGGNRMRYFTFEWRSVYEPYAQP